MCKDQPRSQFLEERNNLKESLKGHVFMDFRGIDLTELALFQWVNIIRHWLIYDQ